MQVYILVFARVLVCQCVCVCVELFLCHVMSLWPSALCTRSLSVSHSPESISTVVTTNCTCARAPTSSHPLPLQIKEKPGNHFASLFPFECLIMTGKCSGPAATESKGTGLMGNCTKMSPFRDLQAHTHPHSAILNFKRWNGIWLLSLFARYKVFFYKVENKK